MLLVSGQSMVMLGAPDRLPACRPGPASTGSSVLTAPSRAGPPNSGVPLTLTSSG
jgi:hypothetical protein